MKSFLASFFVSILLISNGMLTTVIDVCCLNENRMYAQGNACCTQPVEPRKAACCNKALPQESKIDACCTQPVEPRKVTCCNKALPQEAIVESHVCCEFDSWYYFTPKYLEESTFKTLGSSLTNTFWHYTFVTKLDCNAVGLLATYNAEISPPLKESRHLLEHHCMWII
jgi:hypothetical protein